MDDWRLEEAKVQMGFRDFNEGVKLSNEGLGDPRLPHEYVCECDDEACHQPIELTDAEYEAIRLDGARFALAVNHENPEMDWVVAEHERFTTIEKLLLQPARLAREANPRRPGRAGLKG